MGGVSVAAYAEELENEESIAMQGELPEDAIAMQGEASEDAIEIQGEASEDAIDMQDEAPEGVIAIQSNVIEDAAEAEKAEPPAGEIVFEAGETEVYFEKSAASESMMLRAVQNDVITKIEAQTYNGSGPQGDTGQWDVFRLYAEFVLPNGTVHAGDTTTITLPDKLKFNQTSSFFITDDNGNVVANAVINGGAKTVTLTYTDYVEGNSDVTGRFYFYVQIDRDNVDGEEYIPIEVDVSGTTVIGNTIHFLGIGDPEGHYLSKAGWQVTSVSDRAIRYQLSVNTKGEAIQNVTITDKIATPGFTVLQDSIVIMKGTWVAVHGDWQLQNSTDVTGQYDVTWNDDDSFTLKLGDIAATDGFAIRYTAEASYDLVDGEIIRNDAVIRGSNLYDHTASASAYYYEAGGSAEGYVFSIRVIKENRDGDVLAGAVFNVIRDANDQVVGTLTTDAEGKAEISGLLKDSYRIEEVEAPVGYILLEEPVLVDVSDFNSEKIAIKTITNEEDTITISGSKTWDDNNDQDGIRPESITIRLLANGREADSKTVTEADDWSWSFENLPKFEDGTEIAYSITEDSVSDYTTEYSGYDVTNTHEPEVIEINGSKTWDDNENQDGIRPESITIRLFANGTEVDHRTVTEAESWSWTFENLPKFENGEEIMYSITEDAVSGYSAEYIGYDVKNIHKPTKTTVTETNSKTSTPAPRTNAPKTGDDRNIAIYFWMLFLCGGALILILSVIRKRK